MLIAAGVTYYVILALFPGIAAIISIYGLFADPSSIAAHLDTLSGFAPGGAVDLLRGQLTHLAQQNRAALGFGFAVSMVFSLWTANYGVSALFEALTAVYEEKEKRGFVKYYATTLAFTVGTIVLVLLSLATLIALPLVLDHIAHPAVPPVLLKIVRWPILFVLIVLALSVIYRYGPSRTAAQWRWITWGSAFAAVSGLAASASFLVRRQFRQLQQDLWLARRNRRLYDLDVGIDRRRSDWSQARRGTGAPDSAGQGGRLAIRAPARRHASGQRRDPLGHGFELADRLAAKQQRDKGADCDHGQDRAKKDRRRAGMRRHKEGR